MQIIDGKALAEKINDATVREVVGIGKRPNLAIILVGDNPDSVLYVSKKEKAGRQVGIDTHLYKCPADLGQAKLVEMIEFLNSDESIDAIMVQLPLPENQGYDTDEAISRIRPDKDLDRFHPINIAALTSSCTPGQIMPPVFSVIIEMLKSIGYDLNGKKVAVISKSEIFGGSLAKVLVCLGAEAEKVGPDDSALTKKTSQADIIISVVGRPKFIKQAMIKQGAVVIDVGITRELGSTLGDVDFEDCKEKAGYITPVPGGVGPMTVALTMRNALELCKLRKK